MEISEKFCPICKNKNGLGAIVCRYCGALLERYATDEAATTRNTETQTNVPAKIGESRIDEVVIPADGIVIYAMGTSKPIDVRSDKEFIIGRKVEETSESFLDLSALDGFELGLSRRHAMIRRGKIGYEVIDLSSTNGTWLNDERLIPNKPYQLVSGAQLRIGRMRFLVLYRSALGTKKNTQVTL